MTIMVAPPSAFGGTIQTRYGNTYVVGSTGVVTVQPQDVDDLFKAGFTTYNPGVGQTIGKISGANMNTTLDQPFTMLIGPGLPFRVTKISTKNASASLTTAAGGVYTNTLKSGGVVVAAGQAYSALTSSTLVNDATVAAATTVYAGGTTLYLSLTTPQGSAATADLYAFGDVYA